MPQNYYEILGVSQNASQEEIKNAYRTLAKQWHPDINDSPKAHSVMQAINAAYEVLSNLSLRKEYDEGLGAFGSGREETPSKKYSYTSYTVTREESEEDFDDWIKDYLKKCRQKYASMEKDMFIKYDEELFDLLVLLDNLDFDSNYFNFLNKVENIKIKMR